MRRDRDRPDAACVADTGCGADALCDGIDALDPDLISSVLLADPADPVAIVAGRNDPYGLARDAALLRERLPHARLDVLEAGHCVSEERAPEFEAIVAEWVSGGFRNRRSEYHA